MERRQIVALALVFLAVLGAALSVAQHAATPPRPPGVGPWDPLIGDPGTAVPRYHVSTAQLTRSPQLNFGAVSDGNWMTFDPYDDAFWVVTTANAVDVVAAASAYEVNATVPVGSAPFDVAAEPYSADVFVTNGQSDNVTVIDADTLQSVASIPVGLDPAGIAICPGGQWAFVANEGSDNVSVISMTSLTVNASIAVGRDPIGLACDPATGELFVADSGSYTLTAISNVFDPTNATVVGTIPVGIGPTGVSVDNRSGTVWVTNAGSQNLTVVNATSFAVVANVPVLDPGWGTIELSDLVYDWGTDQMWAGAGFTYLIVLNGSAENVAYQYTTDPSGAAYDPASGQVCVSNAYNATFECFTKASSAWAVPPITFHETGLPTGTEWSVSEVDGPGLQSDGPNLTFWAGDYFLADLKFDYSFLIQPAGGQVPASAAVAVPAPTKAVVVNVSFATGGAIGAVQFNASGLPSGVGWNVDVGGSLLEGAADALSQSFQVGTIPFTVGASAGATPSPSTGNVTVSSGTTYQTIDFTTTFSNVTFAETGLPFGTVWYVNLTSGPASNQSGPLTGTSWTVGLPNGSYTYSAATSDRDFGDTENATLVVFGPPASPITVAFPTLSFPFRFVESGLPDGTNWSVTVNGSVAASAIATIAIEAPAGSYSYVVNPVSGYRAAPRNGTLLVTPSGTNSLTIGFTSTSVYNVSFQESGLPTGAGWSVGIGAQFDSSVTSWITFLEPNGTYGYVVGAVAGFTSASSGVVNVSGRNVTVTVRFAPETFPVIVVEFGLPNGTNWSVTMTDRATGANLTEWSTSSAIIFDLPNGTYGVSVSVPSGYAANLSAAQFTVDGSLVEAPSVHFEPATTPGRGTSSPSPSAPAGMVPTAYWFALGGVGAVAIVLAVGWGLSRRRPPPPARSR